MMKLFLFFFFLNFGMCWWSKQSSVLPKFVETVEFRQDLIARCSGCSSEKERESNIQKEIVYQR